MSEERKSRYELFLEEDARKAQPTKRCSKCKEVKLLSEFNKDKSRKLGVTPSCKKCISKTTRKHKNREDRFWKFYHLHTIRVNNCIEWIATLSTDGYPTTIWDRKQVSVRRIVYKLALGELDDDHFVITNCDNRKCVRHSHLVRVSKEYHYATIRRPTGDDHGAHRHPESIKRGDEHYARMHPEKLARGDRHGARLHPKRMAHGTENAAAKLNDNDIREIRREYSAKSTSLRILARKYGVAHTQISNIVRRKTWVHVE